MPSKTSSALLNEHCRRTNASIELRFILWSKPVSLCRRRRCMPGRHSYCAGLKTPFLSGHDSVWDNVTTEGGAHVGRLFDRKCEFNTRELPYTLQENTTSWYRRQGIGRVVLFRTAALTIGVEVDVQTSRKVHYLNKVSARAATKSFRVTSRPLAIVTTHIHLMLLIPLSIVIYILVLP
jgi:hypothetical protein